MELLSIVIIYLIVKKSKITKYDIPEAYPMVENT